MRVHGTIPSLLVSGVVYGSLLVKGHGYCDKVTIGSTEHTTCMGPHYNDLHGASCQTPQRNTVRMDERWVNQPHERLDKDLAVGGPDKGFDSPNIEQITVAAKAGDKVKAHWLNWPTGHVGVVLNMMASCEGSCMGKKGADLDWFKISQETWDPKKEKWSLEIDGATTGIVREFTLPTNLPGGEYMLSQTLIAIHSLEGPQYYVSAWQIDLESDGNTDPSPKMKIPDMYLKDNDATEYKRKIDRPDLYDRSVFRVPGVPVYKGSDSVTAWSGGNGAQDLGGRVPETPSGENPLPYAVPVIPSDKSSKDVPSLNLPVANETVATGSPAPAPSVTNPSVVTPVSDTTGSSFEACDKTLANCRAPVASDPIAYDQCGVDYVECQKSVLSSASAPPKLIRRHIRDRHLS